MIKKYYSVLKILPCGSDLFVAGLLDPTELLEKAKDFEKTVEFQRLFGKGSFIVFDRSEIKYDSPFAKKERIYDNTCVYNILR